MDWLLKTFSPTRRALVASSCEKIKSLNLGWGGIMDQVRAINAYAGNKYILTHIEAHADKYSPTVTINLLKAMEPKDGSKTGVEALTDYHFETHYELREMLNQKRRLSTWYPSSPKATAMSDSADRLLFHVLHNLDDAIMVSEIMRTRDLWNYEDVMSALQGAKESGHSAFASGAL